MVCRKLKSMHNLNRVFVYVNREMFYRFIHSKMYLPCCRISTPTVWLPSAEEAHEYQESIYIHSKIPEIFKTVSLVQKHQIIKDLSWSFNLKFILFFSIADWLKTSVVQPNTSNFSTHGIYHDSFQLHYILTCTLRASCYSTCLSWEHTTVISWVVCLGQKVSN